jgi:hypothetical protein
MGLLLRLTYGGQPLEEIQTEFNEWWPHPDVRYFRPFMFKFPDEKVWHVVSALQGERRMLLDPTKSYAEGFAYIWLCADLLLGTYIRLIGTYEIQTDQFEWGIT